MRVYSMDFPVGDDPYDTKDRRKYIMQLYDDGTVGYFNIDGDKYENFYTHSKVIAQQSEDESIEEFKHKNNIYLNNKQYGFSESNDRRCNDRDEDIRQNVAEYGYGLNKLLYDDSEYVRREVAKHGYNLDILVNDYDYIVRKAVAEQGYGLDKLVYDKDYRVRLAVAKQNYELSILANDPEKEIRDIAISKICDLSDVKY